MATLQPVPQIGQHNFVTFLDAVAQRVITSGLSTTHGRPESPL